MNINVSQTVRPIKLAILIKPNNRTSFLRATRLCCSLWGGKHSPILSIYKKFSQDIQREYHFIDVQPLEFYLNTFLNFSPDYIVVNDGLDVEYIKSISGYIEQVSIAEIPNRPGFGKLAQYHAFD